MGDENHCPGSADVEVALFDFLASGSQARSAWIQQLRDRDPECARSVERRLDCLDRIGFLSDPDHDAIDRFATAAEHIAGYRIVRVLGRGGMGTVYLAEQVALRRLVALKIIHPHLASSPRAVERFRREALAASRLEHPTIAHVYEVGNASGAPFLVMQYVAGDSLQQCIDRSGREGRKSVSLPHDSESIDAILLLVERLATALDAAHDAGLVHRDVKPANVLVTPDGSPVLVDFGLASLDDETDHLTLSQDRIGTPLYMAPEQIAGAGRRADARTDVYALGALLFECLALRPPFQATNREQLYRQILHEMPLLPRPGGKSVGRDLEIVLQTALAKDPEHRYRSAGLLAADLRAVRLRTAISARPPGPWLRLQRFVHRHPVPAMLVALLTIALAAAISLLEQRNEALARHHVVELARQAAEAGADSPQLSLHLAISALDREETFATRSAVYNAIIACRERRRFQHERALWGAAFSHEERRVLTWSDDGTAALWDRDTGSRIRLHHGGPVHWAEFAPAGAPIQNIATTSYDGTAAIWDGEGKLRFRLVHGGMPSPFDFPRAILEPSYASMVLRAAFSPDGGHLLTTCSDRVLRVFDVSTGQRLCEFSGQRGLVYLGAAWAPDGSTVATATDYSELQAPPDPDFEVVLWSPFSGQVQQRLPHRESVPWVEFSPDGTRIATACRDGYARIWRRHDGKLLMTLPHRGPVWRARWSADGRTLLTASDDHTAHLWHVLGPGAETPSADPTALLTLHHPGRVFDARFARADTMIVTASYDTARGFDLDGRELWRLVGHGDRIVDVRVSSDGRSVLTASWDRTARSWSVVDPDLPILLGHRGGISGLAAAPGGEVVSVAMDGELRIWDLRAATSRALTIPHNSHTVDVSADGRLLVAYFNSLVHVYSWHDGLVEQELPCAGLLGATARWIAGGQIATGSSTGLVQRWGADGSDLGTIGRAANRVYAMDVAQAGALLAWGSWSGQVAAVDGKGGIRQWQAHPPTNWVNCVALDPDGKCIASGSLDRSVRVWSTAGELLFAPLEGHRGAVWSVDWSHDGRWIASGALDGSVRIWRSADGAPWALLQGHDGPVRAVLFLADGRLLSAGDDGRIVTWPAPQMVRDHAVRRLGTLDAAEQAQFDAAMSGR